MTKTKSKPKEDVKPVEAVEDLGPLTVDALFNFIQARKAEKVQIIRVTGTGRLDAAINPKRIGNILLLIEIDPTSGTVV